MRSSGHARVRQECSCERHLATTGAPTRADERGMITKGRNRKDLAVEGRKKAKSEAGAQQSIMNLGASRNLRRMRQRRDEGAWGECTSGGSAQPMPCISAKMHNSSHMIPGSSTVSEGENHGYAINKLQIPNNRPISWSQGCGGGGMGLR